MQYPVNMKKLVLLVIGVFLACNSSQKTVAPADGSSGTTAQENASAENYATTITEAELKEHLFTYASDEFEGRETGKEGQKKAVEYIRKHYQDLGIPAAKKDGDYLQKVPLEIPMLPIGTITVNNSTYSIGEEFITFRDIVGEYDEIVYVGYGIEDAKYSDYSGLDVRDKIVLMKFGEPMNADGTFLLSGNSEKSDWSNASEAIGKRNTLAIEKGVKGVLYYDEANYTSYTRYYNSMQRRKSDKLGLKSANKNPVVVYLNKEMATAVYADIGENVAPKSLQSKITFDLENNNDKISTENVAAIIRGSEKPEEYIIISSHLDHIGVSADGEINNGADDDGSGTVAMLEIAEAFKMAADKGNGPRRSIVFLHVTGEEKGLLGSQYYTDMDPIFPLAQTVANLNIDMIGRIDPKRNGDRNYVYLIGSDKLSTDLHQLSEEVNGKYANLELDYKYNDENDPNRFYYRSDHYNFAKNNIPIIFYFNGTHEDYHRPGDTPDKINYDLLENRSRLIFHTAWAVANRDQRVIVDKASK